MGTLKARRTERKEIDELYLDVGAQEQPFVWKNINFRMPLTFRRLQSTRKSREGRDRTALNHVHMRSLWSSQPAASFSQAPR
jgi:hypothetical protein